MKIQRSVNGKEIVDHGEILVVNGDDTVTIELENLAFIFKFDPSDGEPLCSTSNPTPLSVQFRIFGTMPSTCVWKYQDIATIGGRSVNLAFSAEIYGSRTTAHSGYRLSYTFTYAAGFAEALAGLLS